MEETDGMEGNGKWLDDVATRSLMGTSRHGERLIFYMLEPLWHRKRDRPKRVGRRHVGRVVTRDRKCYMDSLLFEDLLAARPGETGRPS